MARQTLCTTLVLAGLLFWVLAVRHEQTLTSEPRRLVDRDLHLVAELLPDNHWNAGRFPNIRVKIVNRSRNRTHRIVQTAEGCSEGVREPLLTYSAIWYPENGQSRKLTSGFEDGGMWRCVPTPLDGWTAEVVELHPGKELALWNYGNPPLFDFTSSGRAEIRAHYSYSAGSRPAERGLVCRTALDRMAGVSPFELTSEPILIDIRRPLELSIRTKQVARVGQTYSPTDLFEVSLANRGDRETTLRPSRDGSGDWLVLWLDRPTGVEPGYGTSFGRGRPMLSPAWDLDDEALRLPAGATAILSGGSGATPLPIEGRYGRWTPKAAGTYWVRAGYAQRDYLPGHGNAGYYATYEFGLWTMAAIGMVKSEWVEVRVLP